MLTRRQHTRVLYLERDRSPVGTISPGNTLGSLPHIFRAAASQQRLSSRQLTDSNRIYPAGVVKSEVRVNFWVVLTVIAHQRPRQLWEIFRKSSQRIDLMGHTRPKPTILGRAPRRQQ